MYIVCVIGHTRHTCAALAILTSKTCLSEINNLLKLKKGPSSMNEKLCKQMMVLKEVGVSLNLCTDLPSPPLMYYLYRIAGPENCS